MRNADDASQLTQRDLSRYFCVAPARPVLCSPSIAHTNTRAYAFAIHGTRMDGERERERERKREKEADFVESFNLYIVERPDDSSSRSRFSVRGKISR